ncbi:ankyrin repeat, SAM and basic leucine zipper domain-containing protein 1-like [Corticium candelabrum]|uniref:ankyrin repeat, SAM and basic leucine zipper domain-containing protein 1-like n=1 Tax=Corticium candelabrum TaxID=121492 RepID=UPI002E2742DC|nr:ankyrin repeat, SAM and basic leucine zipper domain-containing protein 1-like [Corticium candelabrum]
MALPAGFYDDDDDDDDEFGFGYEPTVEKSSHSLLRSSSVEEPEKGLTNHHSHSLPNGNPTNPQVDTVTLQDLQTAVTRGHVKTVQAYLQQEDCDVDAILPSGWTALLHAANSGQPDTTRLLLEHGADANFHKNMFTAVMAASVATGRDENIAQCVCLLLQHGARVNAHDHSKSTALMFAAREGRLEAVRLLIEYKAEPNRQDSRGWSALSWASQRGRVNVIRYLLDHGADPELACNDGQTPIDLAYSCDHTDIIDLIQASLHHSQSEQIETTPIPAPTQSQACAKYGDLELFLCGIELGSLVPIFQRHQIDFGALLRMRDCDLEKVGISQLGVRKQILEAVGQLHKKEWDASNLNEQFATAIGINEATEILGNVAKHTSYITATVEYVARQIAGNPQMIDPSPLVEATRNFTSELERACHSVDNLRQETEGLREQLHFITNVKQQQLDRRQRKWSVVHVGLLAVAAIVIGREVYARLL